MAVENHFSNGIKDGIPIALGYLSVSFTFGMMAVNMGLPVWAAVLISMTNLTSAGQFAGLSLIVTGAPLAEMALTQLIINVRYALMSLSLSQKLHRSVTVMDRVLLSFGNTDEIFAVSSAKEGEIGKKYLAGLILTPYFGWAAGTFFGAVASTLLPAIVSSALGIAIYAMFLAIIIPPAKKRRAVLAVILLSVTLSCIFKWAPLFSGLSSGFSIIICTLAAAAAGALSSPIKEEETEENP